MKHEVIELLRLMADFVRRVDESAFDYFPDHAIENTKDLKPTRDEVEARLRWVASYIEHPSYIQVSRAVCGWQTMLMVWEDAAPSSSGGFYDVFSTGMGPYGHSKKGYEIACQEAKSWAESDDVEEVKLGTFESYRVYEKRTLAERKAAMNVQSAALIGTTPEDIREHGDK